MTTKFFTTLAITAIAATMLVGCKPTADDTPPAATDAVKSDQTPKSDATTTPSATTIPDKTPATTTPAPTAPGSKPK